MTTRKVTDQFIVTANKIFTLIDTVKLKTSQANIYTEETKNDIIKETKTIVNQWHEVGESALKGGFKLVANQQDIIIDTYDSLKDELSKSYKRSLTILNNSK